MEMVIVLSQPLLVMVWRVLLSVLLVLSGELALLVGVQAAGLAMVQ